MKPLLPCLLAVACGLAEGATVDPDATRETKALHDNLKRIGDQRILFGHQHTTCYGIGWKGDANRSDVKTMAGSFPAVYGWDMGHTGTENMDRLIIDAFQRGGINTISWHMSNLSTGGNSKDVSPDAVKKILPDGKDHERLKRELDRFANFAASLKDRRGRPVPVIFRPWHEHTGGWFWWGSKSCTPEEFNALWRFTITYLRDVRHVHHLLYAISPSGNNFETTDDYEGNRFPGYEWIDVLGFDHYVKQGGIPAIAERCAVLSRMAKRRGKPAALTEFGYRGGLSPCENSNWYVDFLSELKTTPDAAGIAYAMTWRNARKDHFWVPYRGHANEQDFKRFATDPMIILEDSLPDVYR